MQLHPEQNRYKMRQTRPVFNFGSNSPHSTTPPLTPRLRLSNLGRLCVAIQADSPAELIERAEAALADSRFLELRLDALPKPAAALPKSRNSLPPTATRRPSPPAAARALAATLRAL